MTGAKIGIYRIYGGERGIRTLAGLTTTNGLANRPLKPLEYLSENMFDYSTQKNDIFLIKFTFMLI